MILLINASHSDLNRNVHISIAFNTLFLNVHITDIQQSQQMKHWGL